MIDTILAIKGKVKEFEKAVHSDLSKYESAKSRVISLDQTRKQLAGLSLHQDELFEEALVCIERGIYRASHVMAWAAFCDFFEHKLASDGLTKVMAARPAWAKFNTVDELRENIPEHQLVEVARDIRLIGKSEMKTLLGLLSKRNECAHPSPYKPGMNESLGYVAELLSRLEQLQTRTL